MLKLAITKEIGVTPDKLIIYQKTNFDFFKIANFGWNGLVN